MKRETFQKQMRLLAATYPQRELAPDVARDRLAAYWIALSDLEDDLFVAAIQTCVKRSTYFPVPAEIREAYREVSGPQSRWRQLIGERMRLRGVTVVELDAGDERANA